MRFKLGDRVMVTGISRKSHTSKNETVWEESPLPTPMEGIIVGHRVMKSGKIKTYIDEPGLFQSYTITTFHPTKHHIAWLVAVDIRKNHLICFDNQVELLPTLQPDN